MLVSLLAFLLLGPMIRTLTREVEKPVVIVALDESQSIINTRDSASLKQTYQAAISSLQDGLKGTYEVRSVGFGDHVRDAIDFKYSDKETNFTMLYNDLDVQFANRNVGAVIIASDGLFNEGGNPVYGPSRIKVPVYTIALGDTTIRKDFVISQVNHNKMAFLGNSFPVEVIIDARQCAGENGILKIEEDSAVVFTRPITIAGNNYHTTVPVFLDAKKKGIRHLTISITNLAGEVTYSNNVRDVFIEVVENKQKILVLSNAPNPDESALKNAIESSPNYEVKIVNPHDFDGRISDYSLVILHNLPSIATPLEGFKEKIISSGISVWYILGPSSDIRAFNALGYGLQISDQPGRLNQVQAIAPQDFSLFTVSEELRRQVVAWPPLSAPFGIYQTNGNIYPLLFQKIGSVATSQPLLYFFEKEGRKSAVMTGEGIWKWRLADFNANSNHNLCDELISRVVQYLSVRENHSPFRVNTKNSFRENEPIVIDAELYNESDQLINTPEAKISITNSKGAQFPYTFSRTDKTYTLNTGLFPVGNYRFKAEVKLGDKLLVQQGEFSVNALQLETSSTVADHQLLNTLSTRTGGVMFSPAQISQLIDALKRREDLKPISFTHKKLEDLVNLPWFFALLMALLSLEWFLRKRSGNY